jgi:DnaK suppressor protein
MQPDRYSEFRPLLEEKAAELMKTLRGRELIAVERAPDAIDEWTQAADRELNALALHSVSSLLRQVRAALERMKQGTYGLCARCEEEISLKRLRAVPWAERCVRCQEQEDRSKSRNEISAAA